MTPVLSEDQAKEAAGKFKELIKKAGGELVHEENWGLRKLAYPIQKKSSGFYFLVEFKAEGSLVSELEVAFKRDERIMRFLTVSLDKHAIAYNDKKRAGKMAKKQLANA